jgi:hypothetical protein
MVGMNFSTSVNITTALMFVMGMACVGTRAIIFLYLMDMLPLKWQVKTGTVLNFADSCVPLFGTFYFWKLSKNWLWFVIPFGEVTTVITIVALFFLPESPKFLLTKKRYNQARAALNFF